MRMFLLYGWLDQKTVLDECTERKMPNIPAWNEMFCTNWINKIPGYWMVQLPCEFSGIPIICINERSSRQPRNKNTLISLCAARKDFLFSIVVCHFYFVLAFR